jgi:putative ABC transport system permease protein
MATLGALRNPGRTAATATALLIGVTLTTAMVVGAASTRVTANELLDAQYPTDVFVGTKGDAATGAALGPAMRDVPGVASAMTVLRGTVTTEGSTFDVAGVDPRYVAGVLRSRAAVPQPGTITVPERMTDLTGGEGTRLTLTGAGGRSLDVTVHVAGSGERVTMLAPDLRRLDPAALADEVWVRLDDGLDGDRQAQVVQDLSRAAARVDADAFTYGAVQERSGFDDLLTGLLLFVLGLLGVAVLIAVIGVGNTIALSVIERRQELGLLRALGLTRNQLRATLLWEALLIAGVATVLGTVLGAVYGAIGTVCALGAEGDVTIRVPWGQVAAIVAVATLAGAAASVLPSRRAARVSPVAALAAT